MLIIFAWAQAGKDHIQRLTGRTADRDQVSALIFLAMNHDARIQFVDTVRAYHQGAKLVVELDIVLPEEMPLREAHEIGESLQLELEKLEFVERAFVHLDYEWSHKPADEHAVEL